MKYLVISICCLLVLLFLSSSETENEMLVKVLSKEAKELEVFAIEEDDLLFSDVEDSYEEYAYSEILHNYSRFLLSNGNDGSKKTVGLEEEDSKVLLPMVYNAVDPVNEVSLKSS